MPRMEPKISEYEDALLRACNLSTSKECEPTIKHAFEKSAFKEACEKDFVKFAHLYKGGAADPFLRVDRIKQLYNLKIDLDPSVNIDFTLRYVKATFERYGVDQNVVACSNCTRKIGVKKCAGCVSPDRYCCRECQVAAWPAHKGSCGKK